MIQFILKEGVLNDDYLMLPEKSKVFKGQYVAIIKYYEFATHWSNTECVKRFRSKQSLEEYLGKCYPEAQADLDYTGSCLEY